MFGRAITYEPKYVTREKIKSYRQKGGGHIRKKLYRRETFKSREEWLQQRSFGGSSASAIIGKNPWMTNLELYLACVKANYKRRKGVVNDAIILGTKLEPLVRKEVELDFPNYVVHTPRNYEMYRRVDKPYLTATLDGTLFDKAKHKRYILEIKTHDIRNYEDEELWEHGIPENYFIQVIHYLMVMNDYDGVLVAARLRKFDYYNEDGKKLEKVEIKYRWIYRSDPEIQKWIQYLEAEETNFYEKHVLKRIPPQLKV